MDTTAKRLSVTHRFTVGVHVSYITVLLDESGRATGVVITSPAESQTVQTLERDFSQAISDGLQNRRSLDELGRKFDNLVGELDDLADNTDVHLVRAVVEQALLWLARNFTTANGRAGMLDNALEALAVSHVEVVPTTIDGPPCSACGSVMSRSGGSCYVCRNCGSTTGCSM